MNRQFKEDLITMLKLAPIILLITFLVNSMIIFLQEETKVYGKFKSQMFVTMKAIEYDCYK